MEREREKENYMLHLLLFRNHVKPRHTHMHSVQTICSKLSTNRNTMEWARNENEAETSEDMCVFVSVEE